MVSFLLLANKRPHDGHRKGWVDQEYQNQLSFAEKVFEQRNKVGVMLGHLFTRVTSDTRHHPWDNAGKYH